MTDYTIVTYLSDIQDRRLRLSWEEIRGPSNGTEDFE